VETQNEQHSALRFNPRDTDSRTSRESPGPLRISSALLVNSCLIFSIVDTSQDAISFWASVTSSNQQPRFYLRQLEVSQFRQAGADDVVGDCLTPRLCLDKCSSSSSDVTPTLVRSCDPDSRCCRLKAPLESLSSTFTVRHCNSKQQTI
jgi:hypothetical protein